MVFSLLPTAAFAAPTPENFDVVAGDLDGVKGEEVVVLNRDRQQVSVVHHDATRPPATRLRVDALPPSMIHPAEEPVSVRMGAFFGQLRTTALDLVVLYKATARLQLIQNQ